MKLKVLTVAAALSATLSTSGQVIRSERCGTMNHMRELFRDVNYERQFRQDENFIYQLQNGTSNMNARNSNAIINIPVVVHVVYKSAAQNISDAQILSQIEVLNEDFSRTNADTINTPQVWKSVASGTDFRFCLANVDPNGNPTTGIERKLTSVSTFTDDDKVKSVATGGMDAWDVNKYLNIWVCNLGIDLLGYAEMPASAHTNTFGVVNHYQAFGRVGNLDPDYNKGRTCTHEIAHCFRLFHIWGDDDNSSSPCTGSDFVNDTPNQDDATQGCLTFPATDVCNTVIPGFMFMNYMDYTDDACMNMFTADQALRMKNAITAFYPTLNSTTICPVIGISESDLFRFNIYPNPTSGIINVDIATSNYPVKNILISDVLGKIVKKVAWEKQNKSIQQIDLSSEESGIYFITLFSDQYSKTVKISLAN